YFSARETLRDELGAVAGMVALGVYYLLSLLYTPGAQMGAALTAGMAPSGKSLVESAFAAAAAVRSAALGGFGIAAVVGGVGGRRGGGNGGRRVEGDRANKQ